MGKSTVTRTWLAGLVLLAVGLLAAGISVGVMLAYGGTFTKAPVRNGYDFVPSYDSLFWTTIGIMVAGFAGLGNADVAAGRLPSRLRPPGGPLTAGPSSGRPLGPLTLSRRARW